MDEEPKILIDHPEQQRSSFYKIVVLLLLAIPVIFTIWLFSFYRNVDEQILGAATAQQRELAIIEAGNLYNELVNAGMNFDSGPCLTNSVIDNWAFDLVHDPRIAVDELPENQCIDYIKGDVEHIVEFDIEGNLVRAE